MQHLRVTRRYIATFDLRSTERRFFCVCNLRKLPIDVERLRAGEQTNQERTTVTRDEYFVSNRAATRATSVCRAR